MNNQVTRHREKVASLLSGHTFSHQINAAQRAFRHFENGSIENCNIHKYCSLEGNTFENFKFKNGEKDYVDFCNNNNN